MRKLIIFALFLLLLIAACSDEDGPSALPEFNGGNGSGESAIASEGVPPRVEAPTPTSLPPTYTPAPMFHEGHLYLVGSYSGTRIIHIVQPGDTLTKLCDRYGVPISDLARINNIRNINHIRVGDALIIPLPRTDG
jgi:hypothetical protein